MPKKLRQMVNAFSVDGSFYEYVSDDGQLEKTLVYYRNAMFEKDLGRRTSVLDQIQAVFREKLWNLQKLSLMNRFQLRASCVPDNTIESFSISIKSIIYYLSMFETSAPEDKLEFVFRVFDLDGNGYLDQYELRAIVEQMNKVAKQQRWDPVELEPILHQLMNDIDYDSDGKVSLQEWKRGGLTTILLLVLLGFAMVGEGMTEDGSHIWKLRHFNKPTYCNICSNLLVGFGGKQGLSCAICKYTVHERCVRFALGNCIYTYCISRLPSEHMNHHWIEVNSTTKCDKCHKAATVGHTKMCRWCQREVHITCISQIPKVCDFGVHAVHILPPNNLIPRNNRNGAQRQLGLNTSLKAEGDFTGKRPLLVLVNFKSGGRQGERVYGKFRRLLNPHQVVEISVESENKNRKLRGAKEALDLFEPIPNARVLVCGGDGTVSQVLEEMDKYKFNGKRPPVAILPIGTGNDLARCLRWGGSYENRKISKILISIDKSTEIQLDRWELNINLEKHCPGCEAAPSNVINNYFSIGVDAAIAYRFHQMREKNPDRFTSRMKNKLLYFECGTSETLLKTCKNLNLQLDILCDGETLDLTQGPALEGVTLLNIGSIYGGSNLWGSNRKSVPSTWAFSSHYGLNPLICTKNQDCSDGLIEIVGLESAMQMGQIKAGVTSGRRIAQCKSVVITTHKMFPMQVDGEPWMQAPSIIQIIFKNQVPMLQGPKKVKPWNLFRQRFPSDE